MQPFINLLDAVQTTLEQYQQLHTLQIQSADLQHQISVNQTINGEISLTRLCRVFHRQIIQKMRPDLQFVVALFNPENNQTEIIYLFDGEKVIAEDQIQENGMRMLNQPGRSHLNIPLILEGEIIGTMVVQDNASDNRFSKSDQGHLTTLSTQLAQAIVNTQKLLEMQLSVRTSEQESLLLNTLLERIPDQVALKDKNGRYLRVSNALAARFDVQTPDEMIGKTDFDFLEDEEAKLSTTKEQEVLQTGHPHQADISKDQDTWYLSSIIPIYDRMGKINNLLKITRDISVVKEEELRAQQRVNRYLKIIEISNKIHATDDIGKMIEIAAAEIKQTFKASRVQIILKSPQLPRPVENPLQGVESSSSAPG